MIEGYQRDRLDLDSLEKISDLDKALYNGYNSGVAFGKMFLPGDFQRSENSPAHYIMDAELESGRNVPAVFIVAREHAKTTIVKAHIIRDFCYSAKNMRKFAEQTLCPELKQYWNDEADARRPLFIGWCSDRQKKSMANISYVKTALTRNKKIHSVFGNMGGKQMGYQWTTEDIITRDNDKLVSRSNLTSIRGETHEDVDFGTIRYYRVYADDFENEENTKSPKRRAFIRQVLMNAIWPAIDKDMWGARLVINQTPIHYASLGQQFIEMHEKQMVVPELSEAEWRIYVFRATQPEMPGGVLWQGHYNRAKLDRIKAQYAASPEGVAGYYQEYELIVQHSEVSTWGDKNIRFWKGDFTLKYGFPALIIAGGVVPVNIFIGCDPATDIDTGTQDFTVILILAVDIDSNVYVLHYIRDRAMKQMGIRDAKHNLVTEPGCADHLIDMYDRFCTSAATIEDVGITRGVFNDLYTLMEYYKNYNYNWISCEPGGRQKINKIKNGLNSRFSMRKIYLMEWMIDLIYEIKTFGGQMAHDDLIESLFFGVLNSYPPEQGKQKMAEMNVSKRRDQPKIYHQANSWQV